ncbi:MAG: hypothetical protein ACYSWU_03385 [Planctomycetota bacterium]|jgi:hypothetical protein
MPDDAKRQPQEKDPGYATVRDFLLYGISLPERTLRSASGVVSGALRESASLLVPQAFRNSKTYNVMIQQMLDFMAEDVGGVERSDDPDAPPKIENYVARKAVGNFVEMAGLATFHLSPMMLLAVVSDVAYGSQAYLKELADELKQQGVIDQQSTVDHVDDLLEAVAGAARTTAGAFDTPPLSVDGLKQTIDETREAVRSIDPTKVIPQAEVRRLWNEIHQTATSQGVNPLAVSGAMTLYSLGKIGSLGRGALSTVKAAGTLMDRHVIDHYGDALQDIRQRGIYASLAESSRPYIDAVWQNFSTEKTTVTEDILSGKLIGQAWGAARRWLGGGEPTKAEGGEPTGEG